MMRLSQLGRRPNQRSSWLWSLTLLCVSLLFCASTAQACHAHDALLRSPDGKAQLCAPVDECPLCAAPHVALAAETQITVDRTPQVEVLVPASVSVSRRFAIPFDLFSRPPPVAPRNDATARTGARSELKKPATPCPTSRWTQTRPQIDRSSS